MAYHLCAHIYILYFSVFIKYEYYLNTNWLYFVLCYVSFLFFQDYHTIKPFKICEITYLDGCHNFYIWNTPNYSRVIKLVDNYANYDFFSSSFRINFANICILFFWKK